MINDKYDGFGVDLFGKNDAPRESQVLNSTFLGGLKVHQVRDSDSEEYFWLFWMYSVLDCWFLED